MNLRPLRLLAGISIAGLSLLAGCGGGSSSSTQPIAPASTGTVHVIASDDATEDWATIGVKVLSVSLVPEGGGTPVVVYTAPTTVPMINLVQLDQLGELIGNATVPEGTYTDAKLTLSANPGDVTLVTSADPEPGFDVAASTTVPSSNIEIQGATGTTGSLTVPLAIHLVQPLTVTANTTNALDLEFDLKHPAFIVEHWPATSTAPIWAVRFDGPVRHHLVKDLTRLVLRHQIGQVTAVSSDNTTITITKDYATATNPVPASGQSPIPSSVSFNIQADATNGTIFYDVDAKTKTKITDFSAVASTLVNKYVRVAARYQANGVLVGVRIWASTSYQKLWVSPEGHVLHVDTANNVMRVCDESGKPVTVAISANTQFFFRTPQKAQSDSAAIGTGTAFFDGTTPGGLPNLARGFKVHISAVDPLATPLTADTVDIEIARYDGAVSTANSSGFNYTRNFATAKDDYSGMLPYIASTTANGNDGNGNSISGFDWWYFTFPTAAHTGANAVSDFVTAANNVADFGGTVAQQKVWGVSYANWGDGGAVNTTNWYAKFAVIEPTPLPLGTVSSPWATITNGGSFGLTVRGGTQPVTVDLSSVVGSASLVYEVKNVGGIVTITQRDLTNASDLAVVQQALVNGTIVKAYGVPTTGGAVGAYVLFYYTGTLPR